MSSSFAELDFQATPIGAISLRRRRELTTGADVYEIKLGDEFLMSSQFTVSEIALARLAIAAHGSSSIDVAVGGLGLGYTALAALEDQSVATLLVVEYLEAVIDWHRCGLLPLGSELTADKRCRLVQGDFFALVQGAGGLDPQEAGRRFDVLLVDIDHSPEMLLDARSRDFYCQYGLRDVLRHLKPGGIFALWSNDGPDDLFTERLSRVFAEAWAVPVTFPNPFQDNVTTQTVYLARCPVEGANAGAEVTT